MKKIANVTVGTPDTSPSLPSHTNGVRGGNAVGNMKKEAGFVDKGDITTATAARSTGINPENRNPIDPRMPNLPPA